ncbi:16S rRNA (guanine966-N2)-methyltransferase [Propionicimonas paludicola]|uniref:16S rRNA (Guanine966-N2)-methyltransferase n=1 Tax=Propionicimonas paludicola TaxID=185243 RepID=A0A2A9CQ09_9ACTN|nr:RsmD family RNA methyltransferase [Propionicimonas paludicola]PFG16428.1 16S rRNA (guanine966-N2)-methyltransferase [Propionicimonas paludicola]
MTRIIAGSRRGQRLHTPDHPGTRPTSDRVREAAFSLICDWAGTVGEPPETTLSGFSFLDLYAGTAAVALEAASRGAAPAWAVESDQRAVAVARRNVADTRLDVRIVAGRVERILTGEAPQAFDIIWADPPYAVELDRLDPVLSAAFEAGWLAADGLFVLERSSRDTPPSWPDQIAESWVRRYGETTLYFAATAGR